ncbi:MAG TPA: CYTH domain-containing protein [Rhodanobacteraceae bacterium]|jgi:adenylate cyclase|nr:CYTH domain-containing protein [Rhodanobacteraceae bacterium]
MAVEIERKFLPASDAWRSAVTRSTRIVQGYLVGAEALAAGQAKAAVRVRVAGEHAWLTVKAAVAGPARSEFEYPLPLADATAMLQTLCGDVVEKVRHIVPLDGFEFEIDEFLGDNRGLVVIELELDEAAQAFPRPAWLGREVTDEVRYYNVNLARHAYVHWSDTERNAC